MPLDGYKQLPVLDCVVTPATERRALLALCSGGRSAAEAREFIDMCGLTIALETARIERTQLVDWALAQGYLRPIEQPA